MIAVFIMDTITAEAGRESMLRKARVLALSSSRTKKESAGTQLSVAANAHDRRHHTVTL